MSDEHKDLRGALSEHEKAAVREQLRTFMRAHPPRAPFLLRALDSFERVVYQPRLQFATGAAALALIAGTGTAFAAQNALPGGALYGIKVNVEEPIAGAFATSPQAKADWNAELAQRRLGEAEQLATQNKLTPSAASTVAAGLNDATEAFDVNVAQIATSSSGIAVAATLESNMEATLAANTQVMSEIANAVPATAPTLAPILSGTTERAAALNEARTQFDVAAAQTSLVQVKAAAETQLDTAEGQVSSIRLNAPSASSASSSAAEQTQAAEDDIQSGRQNLADGNYVAALETLQAASVEANTAQLNVSIGARLAGSAAVSTSSTSPASVLPGVLGQATSTAATSTSLEASSTLSSHRDGASENGR